MHPKKSDYRAGTFFRIFMLFKMIKSMKIIKFRQSTADSRYPALEGAGVGERTTRSNQRLGCSKTPGGRNSEERSGDGRVHSKSGTLSREAPRHRLAEVVGDGLGLRVSDVSVRATA